VDNHYIADLLQSKLLNRSIFEVTTKICLRIFDSHRV